MASNNYCAACLRALRQQMLHTRTQQVWSNLCLCFRPITKPNTLSYAPLPPGHSLIIGPSPYPHLPPPLKPSRKPPQQHTCLPQQPIHQPNHLNRPNHPSPIPPNPIRFPPPPDSLPKSTNSPPLSQKPTSPTASARSSPKNAPAKPTTPSRNATRRTA